VVIAIVAVRVMVVVPMAHLMPIMMIVVMLVRRGERQTGRTEQGHARQQALNGFHRASSFAFVDEILARRQDDAIVGMRG
jgi:hypothetical protein